MLFKISKKQRAEYLLSAFFSFVFMFVAHDTKLDVKIASYFYSEELSWIYRNNFLTEKIFHKGGVIFLEVLFLVLLTLIFYLWKKKTNTDLLRYFIFVLLSSILSMALVKILKMTTTLPCPWRCVEFGGEEVRPALWQLFSPSISNGKCFPAGHSSGGFALLSLYFAQNVHSVWKNNKKKILLFPGILIGSLFAITQQMRGAHFLSHDFATLVVTFLSFYAVAFGFEHFYREKELK